MKKFITTLLSLALVIGMCPAMIANAETTLSGTGVADDPYIIATADDLKAARDLINADTDGTGAAAACYEVTADITLPEGELWTPITPYSPYFTGTFDGNEHVIYNVNIELNNDNYVNYLNKPYLAFFGGINDGAVVKDLGLDGVKVTNNATYSTTNNTWQRIPGALAGFVGYFRADAEVSNCFVKHATIAQNGGATPYAPVGGFCGKGGDTATPKFTNCYVYDATISSTCKNSSYRDYLAGFGADPNYAKTTYTNCYTAQTFITQATSENEPFYAFAKKGLGGGANSTATNCYAEADDIATITDATNSSGEHIATYDYDATKSLGTVGTTKEAIVEAMTAEGIGYESVATINNGYPCLAWEVPEDTLTGSGSVDDPYLIESASDLCAARDLINADTTGTGAAAAYYELDGDIDLTEVAWEPIGPTSSNPFKGTFDGNGHVVKNVTITCNNAFADNYESALALGFFGRVTNGTVKNLGLDGVTITNTAGYTASGWNRKLNSMGGFVANATSSTIENCFIKNAKLTYSVNGMTMTNGTVGGFVGAVNEADSVEAVTKDCYASNIELVSTSTTDTTNAPNLSGFLGSTSFSVTLTNCYVSDVTGTFKEGIATRSFYAFGLITSTGTQSNLFSTAADSLGTSASTSQKYSGKNSATTTDISTTLLAVENTNWKSGTGINSNGVPALSWEPAPVVEVVAPYVVKQVSTAKDTVTLTVNNATEGDQIYIATYDSEGRLIAVDVQNVATTITTAVSADNAATVKVFIWNGVTPVIDAVVKDLY